MYVSRGLAAKHPVRYRCPPEITRLILQPTPAATPHGPQASRSLHA
jgi:hypothetical protein